MNLAPVLRQRFFTTNGATLPGGKLYTYQAGTTTPLTTYKNAAGSSSHTNPIILDANGEIPENIWLDPTLSYKFVLHNSSDSLQWTLDDVIGSLTADSVGTTQLQTGAVTSVKIADDAITQDKLADQVYGAEEVQNMGLAASVAANALTITLTNGAGSAPTSSSPVRIPFKNSTAATGTPVFRTVTSSITATISSGSTLGSVSGKANWIYVYALDNGGTVELAFSASKNWDEGTLQTTTAEGGAGAADSKSVLYANNARSAKAVRLLGRIKSTQATAGTWATAPSEISLFPVERSVPRSEVWVNTTTGFGSSGNKIRTYSNTQLSMGSAITYTSDTTNGDYFTINEDGLYSMTAVDGNSGGLSTIGFSRNSSQLSTSLIAISDADNLVFNITISGQYGTVGVTTYLTAGDVIRVHTDGSPNVADVLARARIIKVSN